LNILNDEVHTNSATYKTIELLKANL